MVGRSVTLTKRRTDTGGRREDAAPPALELRGVSTSFGHTAIDLTLARGRVLGIYGLVGAGRTELAKAIMGVGAVTGGRILRDGSPVSIRNPDEAIHRFRIGYVSEDRKGDGLILEHPVGRNLGITVWDRIKRRLGYLTEERQLREVQPALDRMDVKYSSPFQPVGQLSGGNQQKVSVGKWLAADVDVLIVDEPTIGVDVRTKDDVYVLVEELAAEGRAILLISSDLAEIVRMSDDIVVMAGMQVVDELENDGDYPALSERIMTSIMRAAGLG
jgi:ribose transport system ATP-binding protein